MNVETGRELGVLRDHRINSLVSAVLGEERGRVANYVRDMLLRHKGVPASLAFRKVVEWVTGFQKSLPERKLVDCKRTVRWIRERECSRRAFVDLYECLRCSCELQALMEKESIWEQFEKVVDNT